MPGKTRACTALICLLTLFPNTAPVSLAETLHHVVIVTSSDGTYEARVAARVQGELALDGTRTVIVSADATSTGTQWCSG